MSYALKYRLVREDERNIPLFDAGKVAPVSRNLGKGGRRTLEALTRGGRSIEYLSPIAKGCFAAATFRCRKTKEKKSDRGGLTGNQRTCKVCDSPLGNRRRERRGEMMERWSQACGTWILERGCKCHRLELESERVRMASAVEFFDK